MARTAITLLALTALGLSAGCGNTSGSASDDPPTTLTTAGPDSTTTSTTATTEPPEPTEDLCDGVTLADPVAIEHPPGVLSEISGAILSERSEDAVWVHEDSGHPTALTELALDGALVSRWEVPDIDMVDWEDIAVVEIDSRRHLVIGDIGDNLRRRDSVHLVRVPEPSPDDASGVTASPAIIELVLPDGPRDAEALLVDPESGDVVIITKTITGAADVLVADAAATMTHGTRVDLALAGTLPLGPTQAVLAGDLAPDGTAIGLRTPTRVLLWDHVPGEGLADTLLDTSPCVAPSVFDIFGEALALMPDGYVLAGESDAPELVVARR
jgi:hypothetical protein